MAATGPTAWNTPDAFVGRATLSAYEPWPVITGSQYSSISSAPVIHWNQPTPIAIKNIVLQNSLNASVAGATSQNSSGSVGYSYAASAFLFSRQDYAANSTNFWPVRSGSLGLSCSFSHSSGSQSFGLSWVTDTAGGTSNLTTTSSDGAWSGYITGQRVMYMPFQTTIPAGEYWMVFQHSSSSATSNSNVTLASVSQLLIADQRAFAPWAMGASASNSLTPGPGQNVGVMNLPVTFSTTTPLAIGTAERAVWFALSNA